MVYLIKFFSREHFMNCFLIMLFGCWKYTPDDFIFIYIEKMLSYNWIIFCVSLFLIAVFFAGALFCCWCVFLLLVRFSAAGAFFCCYCCYRCKPAHTWWWWWCSCTGYQGNFARGAMEAGAYCTAAACAAAAQLSACRRVSMSYAV